MACTSWRWRLKNSPGPVYDVDLMPDQVADVFLSTSVKHLQLSEDSINRCLAKLSDEQMWYRGADHENSDRKSTRLNSSHQCLSRMPSSA